MKPQEARDMSDVELRTREHELADEVFHLRLKRATSQLPNPMKVRQTKRDLARVKTVLRQREAVNAAKGAGGRARERSSRPTGSGARGGSRAGVGPQRPQGASTGRAPRRDGGGGARAHSSCARREPRVGWSAGSVATEL